MRLARVFVMLLGLAALAAPGALARHPAGAMDEEPARGLQYDGLRPASDEGPCRGVGYEFTVGVTIGCTHGPDPAPEGVDVRESPSLAELRASTRAARPVPCIGDGASGPRVQAVYAFQLGQPNRVETLGPLIQGWAAEANDIVHASAAQQGGTREIRFVTDRDCRVEVLPVGVSPAAAGGDFRRTITELVSRGLSRADRKYLVWMDANAFCGIAQSYDNRSPLQTNPNNGYTPLGLFARVDRGCWGDMRGPDRSHVETHELVHTLGAVLSTAPNRSAEGHCSDDFDIMCYDDDSNGSTYPVSVVCGNPLFERRLDCHGDDYFNVAPPAGSWLAQNWNTANSAFLENGDAVAIPAAPAGLRLVSADVSRLVVEWGSVPGAVGYEVYLDGLRVAGGPSPRADLSGLLCGRALTVGVETLGSNGLLSARTTLAASTLACPDRQPPAVAPRAASGRRGRLVRLRYGVSDAAETSETVTILRGSTRLKTLTTAFGRSPSGRSVRWLIPRRAKGPLRFCVRATDRGGNPSTTRCAAIRLTR